ncbi:hypothetical protein SADUNF_Sadunf12G0086500 [Salix dunnii]|uniref:Uncharacterized protein n=1 Tax=Salix dunnii TaxID=1413687 RepID=A0A835JLA9_9ROSI|nr:hypothetical protein SADUNF_Sadunf12G0086500 [Salix dunnii]
MEDDRGRFTADTFNNGARGIDNSFDDETPFVNTESAILLAELEHVHLIKEPMIIKHSRTRILATILWKKLFQSRMMSWSINPEATFKGQNIVQSFNVDPIINIEPIMAQ